MTLFSALRHVAVHIPQERQSCEQIEELFALRSPDTALRPGVLRQMFGLESRTIAPHDQLPSDLAASAVREVLDRGGRTAREIDLLIFAGITQDLVEPATAHVVAAKVGLSAPVFDLRNACNGFVNALEVADALIKAGGYRRILVAVGEVLSRLSRWSVPDRARLPLALASLTFGDLGAAALIEARDRPGLIGSRFLANSRGWSAATLADPYVSYGRLDEVRVDSPALAASFVGLHEQIAPALDDIGVKSGELALACVHQPSVPFTRLICDYVGIPGQSVIATFPAHGNVATATLPLQLALAVERGGLNEGDLVGLFGFASGASLAVAVLRW
jgi:acyl-CoA:acyl-CoA alkyltransferase